MKLTVLVPSETYKSSAGSRIRYKRLAPRLAALGIELSLREISENGAAAGCDILIVSKCHDARALVVAAEAGGYGKLVGVDLFDDYFSDPADSRLLSYRSWLTQMAGFCDFALCSTEKMADVARAYSRNWHVHVLNDPGPEMGPGEIASLASRKLAAARDEATITIGWFGVGDNRYFPVGLRDVAAYGGALSELTRSGMQVRLQLLTNRRALTAEGLALIQSLPIPADVREWSEAAEAALLEEAFAVFLPVSARPFSIAKSLNRAVTALTAGCQVLSLGYPLYASLGPMIYRSVSELVRDVGKNSMRLSAGTAGDWGPMLDALASSEEEARALIAFLSHLPSPRGKGRQIALVHGRATHPDAHCMAQGANGLSIASPYCTAVLDFDIVFRGSDDGLRMLVSRRVMNRLLPGSRPPPPRSGWQADAGYVEIPPQASWGKGKGNGASDWRTAPVPFQLASYERVMTEIEERITGAFGESRTLFSERAPLPFPVPPFGRTDGAA